VVFGRRWTALDRGGLREVLPNAAERCELGGVRLLSPKTIAVMTSDQLLPGMALAGFENLAPTPEMGQSFGLGSAVRTKLGPNSLDGSVGDYFWVGSYGTYFWIDPQTKTFGLLLVQMPFPQSGPYRRALRDLVYGAMVRYDETESSSMAGTKPGMFWPCGVFSILRRTRF
jgi:CubicO group peptidase (beta-lactamase class C family)